MCVSVCVCAYLFREAVVKHLLAHCHGKLHKKKHLVPITILCHRYYYSHSAEEKTRLKEFELLV